MDATEQAAEQLVRMTLSGSEVAFRITGASAKNLAAALMAAASSTEQTKGKTRLANMLKSGKELKVFQVENKDLKAFAKEAKKYGVLYVVVKRPSSKDGEHTLIDLMVKAEDASKINRIIDKLDIARLDSTSVDAVVDDIEKSRSTEGAEPKETGVQDKDRAARLLDELQAKPARADKETPDDPLVKTPDIENQSERMSEKGSLLGKDISDNRKDERESRRSVREKIDEIKKERKEVADTGKAKSPEKPLSHIQPNNNPKKAKNVKGR